MGREGGRAARCTQMRHIDQDITITFIAGEELHYDYNNETAEWRQEENWISDGDNGWTFRGNNGRTSTGSEPSNPPKVDTVSCYL